MGSRLGDETQYRELAITSAPRIARLLAPGGPPRSVCVRREGATLVAVPGRYSVTYLIVAAPRAAIVDVGSSSDVALVRHTLRCLPDVETVSYVLPTHLHFDHVMGIEDAANAFGATIAFGRVSHDHIRSGTPIPWPRRLAGVRGVPGWVMQGMPRLPRRDWANGLRFGFPWTPNTFSAPQGPVLDDGDELPGFPGWSVLHTPGHSVDSMCLHHAASGFLVAGDTLRNYRGGEWNGLLHDPNAYAATRARLLSLPVQLAAPGHGPLLAGEGLLRRLREATLLPW